MIRKTFSLILLLCSLSLSASDEGYLFNEQDIVDIVKRARERSHDKIQTLNSSELLLNALDFYQKELKDLKDYPEERLIESYKTEQTLLAVHEIFKEEYGDVIIDEPTWIWNNVGTVFARMLILHCSPSEYVVIFGSALAHEGFSGHYSKMDVWDIMITGEMNSYGPERLNSVPRRYLPLDVSLLKKRETRFYNMSENTYMVDYGRGNIAYAFYQGIVAPSLFINHDTDSLRTQLKECGMNAIKNYFSKWF